MTGSPSGPKLTPMILLCWVFVPACRRSCGLLLAVRKGSPTLPWAGILNHLDPCMSPLLTPWPLLLLTRRPRSCFVPGPRPAVGEGEPDGEDGGVGVVCYPWGGHVGRGSDCHGVGPWCVATTVLMLQLPGTSAFLSQSMGLFLRPWSSELQSGKYSACFLIIPPGIRDTFTF